MTPLSEECANANLGDRRLSRRLERIADAAERVSGASLPQRAGSAAALEGTYRFFANEKVGLSIETAVAWRLLLLRWIAQHRPDVAAIPTGASTPAAPCSNWPDSGDTSRTTARQVGSFSAAALTSS
jgi:hypothetical protein